MYLKLTLLALLTFWAGDSFCQDFRLAAVHYRHFGNLGDWPPIDSSRYIYLTNFGGLPMDEVIKYDTLKHMGWDGSNYIPGRISTQTINGNGWIMEERWYSVEGTLTNGDFKGTYTRDGNGNCTEELWEEWDNGSWVNEGRYLRGYDQNNNLLWEEEQTYMNNTWEPVDVSVYNYNTANTIVRRVNAEYNAGTNQYDSTWLVNYYNNVNDQPDSIITHDQVSGWVPYMRWRYTYGPGLNSYLILGSWLNNAWHDGNQYFTYTNTNNIVIGDSTLIFQNNAWQRYRKGTATLDGNNRRIRYHTLQWNNNTNAYIDYSIDSMEYNSDGLISRRKSIRWNPTAGSWGYQADQDVRYYYEGYTANVSGTQKAMIGDLLVYPTLTSGNINVSMKWNEAQDFKVVIYDMQGRLVKQIGEKATKDYNRSIPVHELSPGNYILQIKGKNGSVQERFIITN